MPFVEANPKTEYQEFKLSDGTTFKLPKVPAQNVTHLRSDPLTHASYFQRQREQHQAEQLGIALLGLLLVAALAIIYTKRREIFSASESAMISTLAGGVRVKRRAQAYGDRIRTKVVERADGAKHPTPPVE